MRAEAARVACKEVCTDAIGRTPRQRDTKKTKKKKKRKKKKSSLPIIRRANVRIAKDDL